MSKVEFVALELRATGTVDRKDGATRFTEIVLRPKLTVVAGTDHGRVLQLTDTFLLVDAVTGGTDALVRVTAYPDDGPAQVAVIPVAEGRNAVDCVDTARARRTSLCGRD